MLGQGGAIAERRFQLSGWMDGVRDVAREWKVVATGSVIGVIFGIIPAIGASASTWVAYGHAVSTAKDKSMVGKVDPRGMLAPEGANNATITTDLVPTLLLPARGRPRPSSSARLAGVIPGPRFVQMNLDLMLIVGRGDRAVPAPRSASLEPWIARSPASIRLVAARSRRLLLGSFDSKKRCSTSIRSSLRRARRVMKSAQLRRPLSWFRARRSIEAIFGRHQLRWTGQRGDRARPDRARGPAPRAHVRRAIRREIGGARERAAPAALGKWATPQSRDDRGCLGSGGLAGTAGCLRSISREAR